MSAHTHTKHSKLTARLIITMPLNFLITAIEMMILFASGGLLANIIGTLLLKEGVRGNVCIRSAYLHLFSDAVSGMAVIIVKEAIEVIFMTKPPELSIDKIGSEIRAMENTRNIHHVHLWRLNENDTHFTKPNTQTIYINCPLKRSNSISFNFASNVAVIISFLALIKFS